jgi:membrane protein YdbS with pleckstrin-like domain
MNDISDWHRAHSQLLPNARPIAAQHFTPEQGRWTEADSPALRLGALSASLGTAASMIAAINAVVAGAVVWLVMQVFASGFAHWLLAAVGIAFALMLTSGFLRYQCWRFKVFDTATTSHRG